MNLGNTTLATDMVPLGTRALQAILDYIRAYGSAAESGYLEVKSTLDLKERRSIAKIAKFLLGVANRSPSGAKKHFQGYAAMVIGADKDHVRGVSSVLEPHELEGQLRVYLGTEFPPFEIEFLPGGDDRRVMFIVASPPQDGQPMFPCHKDFQGEDRKDNLTDGTIYVRNLTETRPAKAGHVLSLIKRTRGTNRKPLDLEIEFGGEVSRIHGTSQVIEQLFQHKYDTFAEKIAKRKSVEAQSRQDVADSALGVFALTEGLPGLSERPSAKEMQSHLTHWNEQKTNFLERGRNYYLGVVLPGIRLRVLSPGSFIEQPRLHIKFHLCEGIRHRNTQGAKPEDVLPEIMPKHPFGARAMDFDYDPTPHHYPVRWRNIDGDLQVKVSLESLRPSTPWVSHRPEMVALARDKDAATVSMSWALTEHGNDEVAEGRMTLPTGQLLEARELFKAHFLS